MSDKPQDGTRVDSWSQDGKQGYVSHWHAFVTVTFWLAVLYALFG
jgi:hypothetical protein